MTRLGFLCETDPDTDFPISEPALEGVRDSRNTAEWVWPAKSKFKDYHDNMDGEGFKWWLANRLIPAFTARYGPEKKMILVMDNASYHHQLNTNYYPEKKNPANASKSLNAHVLRKAGCNAIKVPKAAMHRGAARTARCTAAVALMGLRTKSSLRRRSCG